MSKPRFTANFGSALIALCAMFFAASASADNGKLNLHIDVGFGSGVIGPLAPPGNNDQQSHFGPKMWVALDYEIVGPFAIEAIGGVGYFFDTKDPLPEIPENLIWSIGAGGRLRFLKDDAGYKNQEGGNAKSNLWISSHIGFHRFDGNQFGLDAAIGYEWSLKKPMQVGAFLRGEGMFKGETSDKFDATLFAGVSLSFELLGKDEDSDGDGLSDTRERELGTDPLDPDSDGDGLTDRIEVKYDTDPNNKDTDGDGVPDGVEDANGNGKVDGGETDPRIGGSISEDTDGDGIADSADKCPDTPADSNVDNRGCLVFEGTSFALKGVNFKTGSAKILSNSKPELQRAAQVLRDNPEVRVEIGGHTDSKGRKKKNESLSLKRAEAVKAHLVGLGIDESRMTTKGYGSAKPIASNKTRKGRAKNRRIEFTRLDDE